MAGGIAHVWNEWGIQILVVFSFFWQVVLLLSAGIRRRRQAHVLLRLLLWLVYLLADSTAIYALGHLSFTSQSRDHRLVAFWAPFLLVHLGGPDGITAYSLEDNRLWLRHLFTLCVQVMGAAFVIYKYVFGTGTTILLAATLMFVVGVLKYGERTWALKCGNMDNIRSTVESSHEDAYISVFSADLRFPFPSKVDDSTKRKLIPEISKKIVKVPSRTLIPWDSENAPTKLRVPLQDEEFLLAAHSLFHMCKSLFADLSIMHSVFKLCSIGIYATGDLYKLVELELSLMYDILYTKATVIHTWYGYCIRVAALLGTLASLLLFLFSDKSGYSVVDVVITYVLLVGALVLEVISVLKTLGSTWTCAMLYCMNWKRPLEHLKYIRRRVNAASKRGWSSSIGQYNMFHLCTRDTTELGSRVASMIWLKDKWNKMHFAGTISLKQDLKILLLETLPKIDARNSRGTQILASRGLDQEHAGWSYWALNTSFDESILVWHIATEIYLSESKSRRAETEQARNRAEAIQVLSNYMMFLLVAKPDMLPGPTRQSQYSKSCNILDNLWRRHQTNRIESEFSVQNEKKAVFQQIQYIGQSMVSALTKLFHHDGPNDDSKVIQREKLAEKMLTTFHGIVRQESLADEAKSLSTPIDGSACIYGLTLAEELLGMKLKKPDLNILEVIFEVWVQILCYAAHHCSRDSHARRLNSGGEFITVVWLLTLHILMQPHIARKMEEAKRRDTQNVTGTAE